MKMRRFLPILWLLAVFMAGCWDLKRSEVILQVDLYSGVSEIALIGETQTEFDQHRRLILDRGPASSPGGLESVGVSQVFDYSNVGTRVFMKAGRVAMISMRRPFRGEIENKKMTLFETNRPRDKTWKEVLIEKLGNPIHEITAGIIGTSGLFYAWGDVAYNAMGPNEIALYRDYEIAKYRKDHLGEDVQIFRVR